MRDDDLLYYWHRAAVENDRAAKARHPEAVAAHRQLATLYVARVEGREPPRTMIRD